MIPVDAQTMRAIAPHFSGANGERQNAIITGVGAVLAATLDRYEINTPSRIAHFLGQTCHESAGFRTTEEFASGADYEGREDLGNTQPGDGVRFKGRGLLQLTGRGNYAKFGPLLGVDLVSDPARAAEPVLSLRIACEFWKLSHINAACDADDIEKVTRLVNGGLNGLDDRTALTDKAKAAIARLTGGAATADDARPLLRLGDKGDAVRALQTALNKLGHGIAVDGDFGPGTQAAVIRFQTSKSLTADGVAGGMTWRALDAATA